MQGAGTKEENKPKGNARADGKYRISYMLCPCVSRPTERQDPVICVSLTSTREGQQGKLDDRHHLAREDKGLA